VTEIELLKKQLAEAQAEIAELRLRLSNSSLLLKIEMTASGKLPKFDQELRGRDSTQK
jgi:hypothetical protein